VLLLVAMLGYHLYPYVPTIDLRKYWHSVRPLLLAPSLPPYALLRYFALWLTTSCLIGAIAGSNALAGFVAFRGFLCLSARC